MFQGDSLVCTSSRSFSDALMDIPTVELNLRKAESTQSKINVSVDDIQLDWNTAKHMALHEQIEFMKTFQRDLKRQLLPPPEIVITDSEDYASMSASDVSSPSVPMQEPFSDQAPLSVVLIADIKRVTLKMKTSSENRFGLCLSSITVDVKEENKCVSCADALVLFDDVELIQAEDIELRLLPMEKLVDTRSQFRHIANTNPRTLGIFIHSFGFLLPYKFQFADSLEQLQGVIKMLKALHKKPKVAGTVERLPPDLIIQCENISIEFEDDPFEVRLADNFALLSDEIEQAIERDNKLNAKLEQIKVEKGAMLSAKKVEELRRNLKEKDSQIYIERSKNMYEDNPPRKMVFQTFMRGLDLCILADESYNGDKNALIKMASINPESPIPDDIKFTTLWCRTVCGGFQFVKVCKFTVAD